MSDKRPELIFLGQRRRMFCCSKTLEPSYKYPFYIKLWDAEKPGHAVFFPPRRWLALGNIKEYIDEGLELIQQGRFVYNSRHVGGGLYVSVKSPFNIVDFRMKLFNFERKEAIYSESGVTLDVKEWQDLKGCIAYAERKFPEILEMKPCYEDDDHMNQQGMLDCYECSPFQAHYRLL